MNHIDTIEGGSPLQVDIERLENLLEAVVFGVQRQLARKTDCTDVVLVKILATEAACLDMAKFRKFLRQELDVNTRTAINFWRKLVSKYSSVHTKTPFFHQ